MKKYLQWLILAGVWAGPAGAAERGGEEQARQMVARAVAAIQADGAERAIAAINAAAPAFRQDDLFVFVYDYEGRLLALAAAHKPTATIAMSDIDGLPLARGLVRLVKAEQKGWYGPYKFADTRSATYEYRKAYCERAGIGMLACVGVYLGQQRN
ncbi:cytochrome c [Oxalobacteraceae bacterium GrIS 1.11]